MKRIRLTKGKFALVDDDDFITLNAISWFAFNNNGNWYARTCLRSVDGSKRKFVTMHSYMNPGVLTDHVDGNGLNNQRCNLRTATNAQNRLNQVNKRAKASSRYRGVSWNKDKNKWRAEIKHLGKRKMLGYFTSEIEAAKAYDKAGFERDPVFFTPNIKEQE